MSSKNTSIGIKLANVPLVNLRLDIMRNLRMFRNDRFRKQFPGPHSGEVRPIVTEKYTWYGMPSDLLTHILRDSIVGLESAVGGAVYCEALDRGIMTKKIMDATDDPFSLKEGGTAHSVYNALPSLIDKAFSLKLVNQDLWGKVKTFYREVRNPIFHSYSIDDDNPDSTLKCLELIWEVYQWLNSWHPLEKVAGGMIKWDEKTLNDPTHVPAMDDDYARRLFPERALLQTDEYELPNQNLPLTKIESVSGLYINSFDRIDLYLKNSDGEKIVLMVPPFEAMRLFDFLKKAQASRGWHVPEHPESM